jgi:ADP-ribosyl-[dinitrogen reductase] hydrolase
MPNGEGKNWVRLCAAINGFRMRYRRWPITVRMSQEQIEDVKSVFMPETFRRLTSRIQLVADEGITVVAEDGSGRQYDYGKEGFPKRKRGTDAVSWLGVEPDTFPGEEERSRYRGSLLGLAAGDALGTTVEFKAPGTFAPLKDIIGGGPFHLETGQWTDDTSMALCLAESFVQCNGFDAQDQMHRYTRWWKERHLSSNGRCFDIGSTVRAALQEFVRTGNPFAGPTDPRSAGNGSLMRLAPVALFFAGDPEKAVYMCSESSRTTHGALACLDACRYFGGLIVGAIQGASKEELIAQRYAPSEHLWERMPLCPEIDEIACGSFKRKEPPEIVGSGYVVRSLEAALWAFSRSSTFKEGCLLAVNLGNDADTTGAIYGQLAGAYYGVSGIPTKWLECLAHGDLIERLADQLFEKRV